MRRWKPPLTDKPLAERVLEGSPPIRLEIYAPVLAEEDDPADYVAAGDWVARFRIIHGESCTVDDLAMGSDAMAAIVNAISGVRGTYERIRRTSGGSWPSSRIPVPVPFGPTTEFDEHIERLIDAEIIAYSQRPR